MAYQIKIDNIKVTLKPSVVKRTDSTLITGEDILDVSVPGSKLINGSVEPGKLNLNDVIKCGVVTSTIDGAQTFNFDTPFINGTDADIHVVVTRTGANSSDAFAVSNTSKFNFTVDRNDSVSGSQGMMYIAINKSYVG